MGGFFPFQQGRPFFELWPNWPKVTVPFGQGKNLYTGFVHQIPPPEKPRLATEGKKMIAKATPFHPKPVPHLGQIARKCPRLWGRNMEGGAHFGGDFFLWLNSKIARHMMVYPWYHVEGEDLNANLYVVSTVVSITEVMSVHGQKAAGHAK